MFNDEERTTSNNFEILLEWAKIGIDDLCQQTINETYMCTADSVNSLLKIYVLSLITFKFLIYLSYGLLNSAREYNIHVLSIFCCCLSA